MTEKRNSATFQKELLAKYQTIKGEFLGGLLTDLTQNNIKIALLARIENLKSGDQSILDNFFEIASDNHKAIKKHDIEAYKPIINFLSKKSDKMRSRETVNLLAFLLDFQPRPLTKYLNSYHKVSNEEEKIDELESNKSKEKVSYKKVHIEKKEKVDLFKTLSLLGIIALLLYIANTFTDFFKKDSVNNPKSLINIETFNANKTYYYYYLTDDKIAITDDKNLENTSGMTIYPVTHQVLNTYFHQQGNDTTSPKYKIIEANYFNKENTLPIIDSKNGIETNHTTVVSKERQAVEAKPTEKLSPSSDLSSKNSIIKPLSTKVVFYSILNNNKIDADIKYLLDEKYKTQYNLTSVSNKSTSLICNGTTNYFYRKSSMTQERIICDLTLKYQLKNKTTNELIVALKEKVTGTGFTRETAKENALKKMALILQ